MVRIVYDENNLYFSFYNYDSTPDQIVARNMQRDGQVYTSDSVVIYLDPGQTRRNAYNVVWTGDHFYRQNHATWLKTRR